MLALLAKRGECIARELAAPFDISQPTASKHIRVLERAGLIAGRVDGRVHQSRLVVKPLDEAQRWITRHRASWKGSVSRPGGYLDDLAGRKGRNGKPNPEGRCRPRYRASPRSCFSGHHPRGRPRPLVLSERGECKLLVEADPAETTRNTFRPRRTSEMADYELRMGELRVFYLMTMHELIVTVIGVKTGGKLVVEGREFKV